jgi:hypothetical protein
MIEGRTLSRELCGMCTYHAPSHMIGLVHTYSFSLQRFSADAVTL